MRRFAVLCACLLLLGGLATAQVAVGARLSPPELEGFAQTGAKSSADLAGRAVLYEFFAFW
ncbi:MAG: hypothetical protein EXS14_09240 [Planctomycetes bacterium]|nr:hypothetical protein [Planctomycetota bacterium]